MLLCPGVKGRDSLGIRGKGTAASIASEPHVVQSAYREPALAPFFTLNMVAVLSQRAAVENRRKPEMTEPHKQRGLEQVSYYHCSATGFQGVGAAVCVPG